MENIRRIIIEKRWLLQIIDSIRFSSVRQHSVVSILFQKKMNKCNNVTDCINLVFGTPNIKPQQVREEVTELLRIVAVNKPKFILEIGTAEGGTLLLFSRVASSDALIISLDLPSAPFFKTFFTQDQKIRFIRQNSHLTETFQSVEEILKGHKLDFLFIDGDHTYDGVKKDFEMYSPLVKKGGMIVFHDVCVHPPPSECEVSKFWHNIKREHKHIEIIKDQKQGWAGIGILYMES